MVLSLNSLSEPIGSIKSWLRAGPTDPLPSGWLICDGSLVVDASSPFNGKNLPDLRGKVSRGHSTLDNASFPGDATYYAGGGGVQAGGADSVNLNHGHSSPGHTHQAFHGHNVSGATHSHGLSGRTGSNSQTVAAQGAAGIVGPGPGPFGHNHNLEGFTQNSSPSLTVPTASVVAQSTNASINNALGSTSIVPTFGGFVTIIKIK